MLGVKENVKYIRTRGGKFVLNVPAHTPDAKERTTESGKTYSYLEYDWIDGLITGLSLNSREWDGKEFEDIEIRMIDSDGDKYVLILSTNSAVGNCFFNLMENIKPEKPVKFSIKRTDERDSLFAEQSGETIKWKYTKANPGNKPQWEQIMVKGKKVWDNTDELLFFKERLNEVAATINVEEGGKVEFPPVSDPRGWGVLQEPVFDNDDDLPF